MPVPRPSITLSRVNDTAPDVEARQLDIYRKMTPAQRLVVACDLSMFARSLALARIRSEHPDWSEAASMAELARIVALGEP